MTRAITAVLLALGMPALPASAGALPGGDTPATAPVVTWAEIQNGYLFNGDTSDNTDFADSGTVRGTDCGPDTAPDEWYTIVIPDTVPAVRLSVVLCFSFYDAKAYLRDASETVIACKDNGCGVGFGGTPALGTVLGPGTYQLAVDGANGSSGEYNGSLNGSELIDGGDTPGSGPVFTWDDIAPFSGVAIGGDTSDNTDAGDSGLVTGTDCQPGAAPDLWYTVDITDAPEPFHTFAITVSLCNAIDAFDTKVYILDDQGAVVGCNDDCKGPASPSAMTVYVPRGVYEVAIDGSGANAGWFDGEIGGKIPRQSCPLDPPCAGDEEGEPCDDVGPDNTNAGCNSTPEAFGSITLDGQTVCGTVWQVGTVRDTDWLAFEITETTPVEVEIRAEMPSQVFVAEMSPGGACPVVSIPNGSIAYSDDCDTFRDLGTGYVLDPGDYILFVAPGCPSCELGVLGNFPCRDGPTTNGHVYEVRLRTDTGPPPPCPWDLNDNGDVDFADILQMISNWGPCPEP